ncbi:MAG: glutathione S-transferase family protein [Gammaproteobacteria bacterium]
MITLYQFNFSHYCEKARWALDHKGIVYKQQNRLPGFHKRPALKLAPKTELPFIVDGDTVVQDSTSIITFLDERYPDSPLTPRNPEAERNALDWEEYLDEEIGVPLRLWFYYYLLPDRNRALSFLLNGTTGYRHQSYRLIFPMVRTKMRVLMNINPESARQAEQRFLGAMERLDHVVRENRFLVGDSFSRTDLTACSLLSPFCAPGMTDEEMTSALPEPVRALRDKHKTRPYFSWVCGIYREYRKYSPACR